MDCFPYLGGWKKKKQRAHRHDKVHPLLSPDHLPSGSDSGNHHPREEEANDQMPSPGRQETLQLSSGLRDDQFLDSKASPSLECKAVKDDSGRVTAQMFTFHELAKATNDFGDCCLLGQGDYYRVYKGRLQSANEVVVIKKLDCKGPQGNTDFLFEASLLGSLHHKNLVDLIGCCSDGDQKLLVCEYVPLGSLKDHLHGFSSDKKRLDWNTRMRIAVGVAKGLEYLHDKVDPPVIYHNMKCSNILLGEGYDPKLSNFGLAKLGPTASDTNLNFAKEWDWQTYAYCAPEYFMTGQLTFKTDVYGFGVVLLELITGRKAVDHSRGGEHILVFWARPFFKDKNKIKRLVDPALEGLYPIKRLHWAVDVAALCLQEKPSTRPCMADIVTALNYIASQE